MAVHIASEEVKFDKVDKADGNVVEEDREDDESDDSDAGGKGAATPFLKSMVEKENSAANQAMMKLLGEVYDEVIALKPETKAIEQFIEAKYNWESHAISVCHPGYCGCVEKTNLLSYINSTKSSPCALCTPAMWDYMVEKKLISHSDMNLIAEIFRHIYHPSRFVLIGHIVNISDASDMKKLVTYRDPTYGCTLIHDIMHTPLDVDSDWLIPIIQRFIDSGFDLQAKEHDEHAEMGEEKKGQTLLDIAIFSMEPKMITFLVKSGIRFEDGEISDRCGIHLKELPPGERRNKVAHDGANAVQATICRLSHRIEEDEKLIKRSVKSAKADGEERKALQDQLACYRKHVFATIEACLEAGYPLALQDAFGFDLWHYIFYFLPRDSEDFVRYYTLLIHFY